MTATDTATSRKTKPARPASSYRGARRNEHRNLPMPDGVAKPSWADWNRRGPYQIGSPAPERGHTTVSHKVIGILGAIGKGFIGGFGSRHPSNRYGGSYWGGGGGAREIARHQGKPEGRMDRSVERMTEMSAARAVATKPARTRKPRKAEAA